jgi:hypothetical protein
VATGAQMTVNACAKMVEAATNHCAAAPAAPPLTQTQPNFDAMAISLAAQSSSLTSIGNALTWGGVVLAIAATIAAIQWGRLVMREAVTEARESAQKWMDDNGFQQVDRTVSAYMAARFAATQAEAVTDAEDVAADLEDSGDEEG